MGLYGRIVYYPVEKANKFLFLQASFAGVILRGPAASKLDA